MPWAFPCTNCGATVRTAASPAQSAVCTNCNTRQVVPADAAPALDLPRPIHAPSGTTLQIPILFICGILSVVLGCGTLLIELFLMVAQAYPHMDASDILSWLAFYLWSCLGFTQILVGIVVLQLDARKRDSTPQQRVREPS